VFGGQQEHSFSGDLKSWMQFKDRSEASRQKADGTKTHERQQKQHNR